jgi:hypothetical protein
MGLHTIDDFMKRRMALVEGNGHVIEEGAISDRGRQRANLRVYCRLAA